MFSLTTHQHFLIMTVCPPLFKEENHFAKVCSTLIFTWRMTLFTYYYYYCCYYCHCCHCYCNCCYTCQTQSIIHKKNYKKKKNENQWKSTKINKNDNLNDDFNVPFSSVQLSSVVLSWVQLSWVQLSCVALSCVKLCTFFKQ